MQYAKETVITRKCTQCKIVKMLSEFYKSKDRQLGHDYRCKECSRIHKTTWRYNNPSKHNTQSRRWRKEHPQASRAIEKRYFQSHPGVKQTKTQRYRARHLSLVRRNAVERMNRRRARIRNATVIPINRLHIYERDHGICQLCWNPVEQEAMTLDHIVALANGGSHEPANVQLAHLQCNRLKGTK